MPAKRLIGVCGSKRACEVTPSDIAEVCEGFAHLSSGTRISYHSGLRRCLEVLDAGAAAYGGIPHVKMPESRTVTVKEAEFEAVLKVASTPLAFILLATRDAALRAGTVYRLTTNSVIKGCVTASTKNGGAITVPMSSRLATFAALAIDRAQTTEEPLIYALGIPPSAFVSSYVTRQLKQAQKKLGIAGWTWHDLRRTAAQRLYEGGGDLRTVQCLLGHKSLGATLMYLNAQRKTITNDDLAMFTSGGKK